MQVVISSEGVIEMVSPHAEELGCIDELLHLRTIVEGGTSAHRQTATYHKAIEDGATSHEALRQVVQQLADEFTEGL